MTIDPLAGEKKRRLGNSTAYLYEGGFIVKSIDREEYDAFLAAAGGTHLSQAVRFVKNGGFKRVVKDRKHHTFVVLKSRGLSLDQCTFSADELPEAKIKVMRDMEIAFKYLLGRGVRHDDIFPRNIVYDRSNNSFVLIDYGKTETIEPGEDRKKILDEMMQDLGKQVRDKMNARSRKRRSRT